MYDDEYPQYNDDYPEDDFDDEDYDAELAADEILAQQELEDFEQADEYFGAAAEDTY